MFIRVLQNDPNWHTLDCLPVHPMPSNARSSPPWADVARLASTPGGPIRLSGTGLT